MTSSSITSNVSEASISFRVLFDCLLFELLESLLADKEAELRLSRFVASSRFDASVPVE